MPVVEPLGVQLDMQLLLKLSLSVASVLLVTWVYRYFSSRVSGTTACLPSARVQDPGEAGERQDGEAACRDRSGAASRPQAELKGAAGERERQEGRRPHGGNSQTSDRPGRPPANNIKQSRLGETRSVADPDQKCSNGEGEAASQIKRAEVSTCNVSFDTAALNLPGARERWGPEGVRSRHSPRFLQRLERSVGVGRELRQDMDHRGAHSSFLSKAEIKVEHANLVLEGAGSDLVVRGKIYDYFVQSSSHSVTDSEPVFGHVERTPSPDSKPGELSESHSRGGGGGGRLVETRAPLSSIIMRDLVLGESAEEPLLLATPPEPGPPAKPALLRKESYRSATEHSTLTTPCLTARAPTPGSPSQTSPCEEPHSASPGISSSMMNTAGRHSRDAPVLETLAGAPFLHLPAKSLNSKDLEGLKSKLDLGNCMEVLGLAKLYGHASLKLAALKVMSDNYLQVLREPALYGRLMACERELIQRQRMKGRRLVMAADMDPQDWAGRTPAESPAAAAATQRRTSSALYCYDDSKDAWSALCPIPREVVSKGCALCTMDNYLFVAVGCQGADREMIPSKRVFCFNPVTSIWKEISPMNQARPHCKLVAVRGYVYAIGGECLSTVERYDPRADRWTFVAPLPNDTFAVGHRTAVCNGEIYITGGTLRYALLRYSPDADAWRPGMTIGAGDRTTDMVAVRSFLYRFEVNPHLGVSVYRYHVVARLWYMCSHKRLTGCPSFRCVVTEDSVYCVGRHFALKFIADEISPAFCGEQMSVLSAAKGVLFPFVLSLPDKEPVQTSV